MAVRSKPRGRWWSRLHFLARLLGLTGLLVGGAGLLLALLREPALSLETVRANLQEGAEPGVLRTAVWLLVGGGAVALLALLVEALVTVIFAAGRRSAFGLNATLQVALAAAVLVGLNVYSFRHYLRFDWTRSQQFTLADPVRRDLEKLRGETTVVVYQRHRTFGQLSDKPDAYDFAAERKVVEKVKDLVEQLREFGPRFRVVVLDVEEEGYNEKLAALTEDAKELREAIEAAPDNSIFFYGRPEGASRGHVQRLSFNDFYRLDKTGSEEAKNLVLLNQGVKPFARKVLNIDTKRPRVGVLVVHEWLTTEGPDEFGLRGLKKALAARGFDVRDVVLKKWSEVAPPEPAVYTYDESKYERLDEQLTAAEAEIKTLEEEVKELGDFAKLWKTSTLAELNKKYAKELKGRMLNETSRQRQLDLIDQNVALRQIILKQYREDREELVKEKNGLNVEGLAERRRISDLKAKLDRSVADCDLLFIPRMTLRNVNIGDRIGNRVYKLEEAQVGAIKDFLKAGKPVLACFGPTNEPADRQDPLAMGAGPDELEDLIAKLGIRFGKQTVLFNVESKSFAERRSGLLIAGTGVDVPPVEFERKAEDSLLAAVQATDRKPNPLQEGMRIVAHSSGKGLDLRLRHPRPIYFEPPAGKEPPFDPAFMMTSAASWNEEQPFPTRERTPRFEPPKPDDPSKGTPDEKRRGPFPIGVAVEVDLPKEWYGENEARPPDPRVRVAAIGHGGLFVGDDLSLPKEQAKEQLLLNTCNWLLGREDLLPHADQTWAYPRVELGGFEKSLWHWATWLGLPAVFAYLGIVVLLVRRLR